MRPIRKRTNTGAILWILSVQYYLIQIVAAMHWPKGNSYSWANNTISDLANTHCGQYGSRLVCSPQHTLMNVSFIILGVTMIVGAALLGRQLAANHKSRFGFFCMELAGVGTILVGLFPENTVSFMHVLGAALPFSLGNLGMIAVGLSLTKLPRPLRIFTIFSGVVGLVALVLFMTNVSLGLGHGGIERVTSYPQSIWMIIFGMYVLVIQSKNESIKS